MCQFCVLVVRPPITRIKFPALLVQQSLLYYLLFSSFSFAERIPGCTWHLSCSGHKANSFSGPCALNNGVGMTCIQTSGFLLLSFGLCSSWHILVRMVFHKSPKYFVLLIFFSLSLVVLVSGCSVPLRFDAPASATEAAIAALVYTHLLPGSEL